jgi:uncharacterized protein involved in exopolysaccharide biosynthesis
MTPGPSVEHYRKDEAVDAMLYALAIWRRRWIVAAAGLACAIVAAVQASFQVPQYEATSTLSVTGSKLSDQASPVTTANFLPLIQNNSVAAKVTAEFRLNGPPYTLTPEEFASRALSVEDVRNSNLIRLHVRLPDAATSAKVANRIAALAVESARAMSQNEVLQARDELEGGVVQARKRLSDAGAPAHGWSATRTARRSRLRAKT